MLKSFSWASTLQVKGKTYKHVILVLSYCTAIPGFPFYIGPFKWLCKATYGPLQGYNLTNELNNNSLNNQFLDTLTTMETHRRPQN